MADHAPVLRTVKIQGRRHSRSSLYSVEEGYSQAGITKNLSASEKSGKLSASGISCFKLSELLCGWRGR